MARAPRSKTFHPEVIGVYHCIQRCVRRAFLCGDDPYTGKNFEHRRDWIRDRMETLAAIFAFEFLTYSVLSNHLHTVVRNRPDLANRWSDKEVVRRWWQIHPKRRQPDGSPEEITPKDIKLALKDRKKVAEWRRRLKDISWLMKELAEPIARRSNLEDEVTGHFWEGRFRLQQLTDESALLTCCIYVDLNPLRAGLGDRLAARVCSSLSDRLRADQARRTNVAGKSKRARRALQRDAQADGWLVPLELNPRKPAPNGPSRGRRRISDRGFLEMNLAKYVELAEWTWKHAGKPEGAPLPPPHLYELLQRNGILPELWTVMMHSYSAWFGRCVGRESSVKKVVKQQKGKWIHGIRRCRQAFSETTK